MKKSTVLVMGISALAILAFSCQRQAKIEYPETATVEVVDNYFGVEVADPFRWL